MIGSIALSLIALHAQSSARKPYYAASGYPSFGTIVAKAGDVDGDGVPDLIVGDPGSVEDGVEPQFWTVSGREARVIHSMKLLSRRDVLYQADGGVDVDGDGVPDVLIAAISTSAAHTSTLTLISGKTARVLRSISTCACVSSAYDSVHFVGDFDHDGVGDVGHLCIAASNEEVSLDIYSGRTGELAARFSIDDPLGAQAGAFAEVGDVDADGVSDFAVLLAARSASRDSGANKSAPAEEQSNASSLGVYSAGRRQWIWRTVFPQSQHWWPDKTLWRGPALKRLGDVDGAPQLIAGVDEFVDVVNGNSGARYRYYERRDKQMEEGFGCAVAALGDVDHDGIPDYAFSTWATGAAWEGCVEARSGGQCRQMWRVVPTVFDDDAYHFGLALAELGDVDGDGACDLVIAADMRRAGGPGTAEVLSGRSDRLIYRFTRNGDDVKVKRSWSLRWL